MSWSSRFGAWAPSRWSPFTSRGDPANTRVSDSDFSYITKEDLARHDQNKTHPHAPRRNSNLGASSRATRDHDILLFRHQKVVHPVHFPPYSIDDGELTIGNARAEAASALNVSDPRRIRMFYKGRNLKDDSSLCRDQGFNSDTSSEILCVIGEPIKTSKHTTDGHAEAPSDAEDYDEDDDNEDDDVDGGSTAAAASATSSDPAKKKKKKSRRKKKSKAGQSDEAAATAGSHVQNVEHLPVPSGVHPSHLNSSATPSQASSRPATPLSPQQKLAGIADKFHDELLPLCKAYIDKPPTEKAKRDFEHKKLSETILAQVLLKLDAVETEGDEQARAKRKALVKEVQGWLTEIDKAVKADTR